MKKINLLRLIASLCLLLSFVIDLLDICIGIPLALHICALPLLLAAIVLYAIFWIRQFKNKK